MRIEHNLCFTGHEPDALGLHRRGEGYEEGDDLVASIRSELERLVRLSYSHGYRRFMSGMGQGVDTWAAEIILALKEELPDAKLIAAVPYVTQWSGWTLDARDRWEGILRRADQVWVTMQGGRRRQAEDLIQEARRRVRERDLDKNVHPLLAARDRWMVDRAAAVIAVWNGQPDGTGNCIRYAEECGRKIIRVDPEALRCTREA